MPKLNIGNKAARMVTFMIALSRPEVAAAMAKHGFSQDDLRDGFDRLNAVVRGKLAIRPPEGVPPSVVAGLDEFENHWFPVARHTLQHRYPEVAEALFLNLVQTTGPEVAVSVRTFIERLGQMEAGEGPFAALAAQGSDARTLLAQRGLRTELLAEARQLLERLTIVHEQKGDVGPSIDELHAAEQAMWSWYLEWSGIARVAVRDKRHLRSLGFRKRKPSNAGDTETEIEVGAHAPLALGANGSVPLALPASTSSSGASNAA